MEITEVRVKLVIGKHDKLRAFCSITIDNDFVVRDLKIIDGVKGPFVAMPSRKSMERCARCGGKNHYRARFCNDCGKPLSQRGGRGRPGEGGAAREDGGEVEDRSRFHTEIAHPINARCREVIQQHVLEKFQEELERSRGADYRYETGEDEEMDDYFAPEGGAAGERRPPAARPAFDEPDLARGPRHRSDVEAAPASRLPPPAAGSGNDTPPPLARPAPAAPAERADRADRASDAASRRSEPRLVEDLEPEDNFGAGIFS